MKDYPQLSIRLPAETKTKIQALSQMSGRPQWRLISEAIDCYLRDRTQAEQLLVEQLLRNGDGRPRKPRRRGGS